MELTDNGLVTVGAGGGGGRVVGRLYGGGGGGCCGAVVRPTRASYIPSRVGTRSSAVVVPVTEDWSLVQHDNTKITT